MTGNIIRTFGSECFNVKENAHDNVFEDNECSGNTESPEYDGSNVELRGHGNIVRNNAITDSAGSNVKIKSDDDDTTRAATSSRTTPSPAPRPNPCASTSAAPQGPFCGNRVTAAVPVDGPSPVTSRRPARKSRVPRAGKPAPAARAGSRPRGSRSGPAP